MTASASLPKTPQNHTKAPPQRTKQPLLSSSRVPGGNRRRKPPDDQWFPSIQYMSGKSQGNRAVTYTRLSMDRNGDGLAVERQLKDARALAAGHGWEVVGEFSDNSVSASSGVRRPGWEQVLAALKDGTADALVGYAPDRFIRRPKDLEVLLEIIESRPVRVATVTAGDYNLDKSGGRGMARMMVTFASMETEQKSERQQAQELQRAERGRPRGGVRPFGYLADGLSPHPVEGPALATAIRGVTSGATLGGVMRDWTMNGISPSRGGKWRYSSLNALLKRPRNAGLSVYRGQIVGTGEWEPLVTVAECILRSVRATVPLSGEPLFRGGLSHCDVAD